MSMSKDVLMWMAVFGAGLTLFVCILDEAVSSLGYDYRFFRFFMKFILAIFVIGLFIYSFILAYYGIIFVFS